MNRNSERLGSGLTVPTIVTLVFVILKLCHVIDWRWIWVLAPIWMTFALAMLVLFVVVLIEAIRRLKK